MNVKKTASRAAFPKEKRLCARRAGTREAGGARALLTIGERQAFALQKLLAFTIINKKKHVYMHAALRSKARAHASRE